MKAFQRVFAFLVLVLLSACEGPGFSESETDMSRDDDEMGGRRIIRPEPKRVQIATRTQQLAAQLEVNELSRWPATNREAWGQTAKLEPPYEEGKLIPILQLPATPNGMARVPRMRTIMLTAKMVMAASDFGLFRWHIVTGVGGAKAVSVFDAVEEQLIQVPAETITVSIFADRYFNVPISLDNTTGNVGAYVADGETGMSSAQYTDYFAIDPSPAPQTIDVDIPNGATSWRLAGLTTTVYAPAVTGPFVATALFQMMGMGSASFALDEFTGQQLLTTHAGGDFIPIPGGAQLLRITNQGVAVGFAGAIIWGIDL